jgi:hypothetical protein
MVNTSKTAIVTGASRESVGLVEAFVKKVSNVVANSRNITSKSICSGREYCTR